MMYKTHCQCILDTAINANFDEVGLKCSVLQYGFQSLSKELESGLKPQ